MCAKRERINIESIVSVVVTFCYTNFSIIKYDTYIVMMCRSISANSNFFIFWKKSILNRRSNIDRFLSCFYLYLYHLTYYYTSFRTYSCNNCMCSRRKTRNIERKISIFITISVMGFTFFFI